MDGNTLSQLHRVLTRRAYRGQFLTDKTALTRQRDRRNGLDAHHQWQGARYKELWRKQPPRIYRLPVEPVTLELAKSDLCGNGGLTSSQSRGRGTESGAVAPFGCGLAQRKILSRSIGGMRPSLKARAKYALSASHGV